VERTFSTVVFTFAFSSLPKARMLRRLLLPVLAAAALAAPAAAQEPPLLPDHPVGDHTDAGYVLATVFSGLGNGAMIALNLDDAPYPRIRGALGIVTGGTALALGASGFVEEMPPALPVLNMCLGFAAVGLGGRNLFFPPKRRSAAGREVTATAAPVASPAGAGLVVNLRF
jgi:hypothetical protein